VATSEHNRWSGNGDANGESRGNNKFPHFDVLILI
jgi:hypothetical protein